MEASDDSKQTESKNKYFINGKDFSHFKPLMEAKGLKKIKLFLLQIFIHPGQKVIARIDPKTVKYLKKIEKEIPFLENAWK